MKFDKERIVKKFGVDLNNLKINPVLHENNSVTKKEIFEKLNDKQKELMKFHYKDSLTWQDLDPRLNRYNSVRYQFIKNSGHKIGEETRAWKCYVENCDFFCSETIQYFITFGDDPEIASKKLGKLGVKLN